MWGEYGVWQAGPGLSRGEGPQAHRALLGHGPRREHSLCSNQLPLPPGSPWTPSGALANPPVYASLDSGIQDLAPADGKKGQKDMVLRQRWRSGNRVLTLHKLPAAWEDTAPFHCDPHTASGPKGTRGAGEEGGVVPECP